MTPPPPPEGTGASAHSSTDSYASPRRPRSCTRGILILSLFLWRTALLRLVCQRRVDPIVRTTSPVLNIPFGDATNGVVSLLQSAQAHNVVVPGGHHYNLPSENITHTVPQDDIYPLPLGLTLYSGVAISCVDDFGDSETMIKNILDIIVETTQEATPTCEFLVISSHLFDFLTWSQIETEQPGLLGTCSRTCFRRNDYLTAATLVILHISGPSILSSNFLHTPLRSPRMWFPSSGTPCIYPTLAPTSFHTTAIPQPLGRSSHTFATTKHGASLLGDSAFLLKQLGLTHTSITQLSSSAVSITNSSFASATVGPSFTP